MHLGMEECRVPFTGHYDLDLVFRITMSGAYLLYYCRYDSKIWCVNASLDGGVSHTIFGSL